MLNKATAAPARGERGDGRAPVNGGARPDPNDLHWRLDEHERTLAEHGEALKPETVAAVVHGAVAALRASVQEDLKAVLAATREDAETDRKVVGELQRLTGKLEELCDDIKALVHALATPTTRTATLQLPNGGAAHMTVREARE